MNAHLYPIARATVLSVALFLIAGQASGQQKYQVNFLGGPDRYGFAADINNAGQSAGTRGNTHQPYAVRWNALFPTHLRPSNPFQYAPTHGAGINAFGHVAGQDTYRATVWNGVRSTPLPNLAPSAQSRATDINDLGQVVGETVLPLGARPTLWTTTTALDLGTLGGTSGTASQLNNAGVVVGSSRLAGDTVEHATLWRDGTIVDLTPGSSFNSGAYSLNEQGQIAGYIGTQAATWSGLSATLLGALAGRVENSVALDINAGGVVVGSSRVYEDMAIDPTNVATLWNGTTAFNLNDFLSASQRAEGWRLTTASAINDQGWIVGSAELGDQGSHAPFLLWVPPIPEPGSFALMGAGLALLGWMRSRRRSDDRA